MSPAHVLEPTYAAIKRRLMSGAWPAGFRLEAARLADLLDVSMTPVRDSLNRLAGEHMVDFVAGEGFRVPRLGETELRNLFRLNRVLLVAPVSKVPRVYKGEDGISGDPVEHVERLFLEIARRTANEELMTAISGINDRLHLARTHDAVIFDDFESELIAFEAALDSRKPTRALRELVLRYHDRREQEAGTFARLLAEAEIQDVA